MSAPTLLSDPRLARLSPPARDLLQRILDKFPHEDLFSDDWRVPAAPAQLRQTCFNCDDTRLDSHIGRQLQELELNSIVILRRVSRRIRSLRLCLDFTSAPVSNTPLIHNPRAGPKERDSKIIAVAAATSSSSGLIQALSGYFPEHNIEAEFDRYFAHRKKIGRPAIPTGFAKWMLRAEVPLKKLDVRCKKYDVAKPVSSHQTSDIEQQTLQLDLFEERARLAFLGHYEERKHRHARALAEISRKTA